MASQLLSRPPRRLALAAVLLLGLGGCALPGYRFVPPTGPWLPGGAPTPAHPAATRPTPARAAHSLYLPPATSQRKGQGGL